MRLLVFLQNAWSPEYAGKHWPRDQWLQALKESRTGVRLKRLVDSLDVCENTTPIVGATPRSCPPADLRYMLGLLILYSPTMVVGCGRQAEHALQEIWMGPLLCVPHPASRVVTTGLYCAARSYLTETYTNRLALRQLRQGWHVESLRRDDAHNEAQNDPQDDPGQVHEVQSPLYLGWQAATERRGLSDL